MGRRGEGEAQGRHICCRVPHAAAPIASSPLPSLLNPPSPAPLQNFLYEHNLQDKPIVVMGISAGASFAVKVGAGPRGRAGPG